MPEDQIPFETLNTQKQEVFTHATRQILFEIVWVKATKEEKDRIVAKPLKLRKEHFPKANLLPIERINRDLNNPKLVKRLTGVAKTHPDDTFDYSYGLNLAVFKSTKKVLSLMVERFERYLEKNKESFCQTSLPVKQSIKRLEAGLKNISEANARRKETQRRVNEIAEASLDKPQEIKSPGEAPIQDQPKAAS